jgi:predicted nucleic acid-binding protein
MRVLLDAAEAYGTVVQLVVAQGYTPRRRVTDLMIAATALANGAAIITRNAADFAGLERLVRIIPA